MIHFVSFCVVYHIIIIIIMIMIIIMIKLNTKTFKYIQLQFQDFSTTKKHFPALYRDFKMRKFPGTLTSTHEEPVSTLYHFRDTTLFYELSYYVTEKRIL